jgi:hypothetical protein
MEVEVGKQSFFIVILRLRPYEGKCEFDESLNITYMGT